MLKYEAHVKDRETIRLAIEAQVCFFCRIPLETWFSKNHFRTGYTSGIPSYEDGIPWTERNVKVCRQCGWWNVHEIKKIAHGYDYHEGHCGATAYLKELDSLDHTAPVEEICRHLRRHPDDRFTIDPYRLEDVVASVYRDLGFRVRVTGRSGDGGIDVVLDGPDNKTIGVQVKRYREKIQLEQIRAFTGALFKNGMARGIFVATSGFTKGAENTVQETAARGIAIELLDGERFIDALKIGQQQEFEYLCDPSFLIELVPLQDGAPDDWAWGM